MSEGIKPALTPEEWAAGEAQRGNYGVRLYRHDGFEAVHIEDPDEVAGCTTMRHAAAALCLYQQPFGFTQEDVEAIKLLSSYAPRVCWQDGAKVSDEDRALANAHQTAQSLADRIASLLPPPTP